MWNIAYEVLTGWLGGAVDIDVNIGVKTGQEKEAVLCGKALLLLCMELRLESGEMVRCSLVSATGDRFPHVWEVKPR